MSVLRRAIRKEPIAALGLLISTLFVLVEYDYIYDKVRNKLVLLVYHSDGIYRSKCRLAHLRIDNRTSEKLVNIRIIIAKDYLGKRDVPNEMKIVYPWEAWTGERKFKFATRERLEVPYSFGNNVLVVPKLNPGEWLDLVMLYYGEGKEQIAQIDAAEENRAKFAKSSENYFTPRIVSASSEDGEAIILHHNATCLSESYKPSNDTWRFWDRTTG